MSHVYGERQICRDEDSEELTDTDALLLATQGQISGRFWAAAKGHGLICNPDEGRKERTVQVWPNPSPPEILRREGPAPHLGSPIELTLITGA